MGKKFKAHSCEWKNEKECEEELEDAGENFEEEQGKEYGEN